MTAPAVAAAPAVDRSRSRVAGLAVAAGIAGIWIASRFGHHPGSVSADLVAGSATLLVAAGVAVLVSRRTAAALAAFAAALASACLQVAAGTRIEAVPSGHTGHAVPPPSIAFGTPQLVALVVTVAAVVGLLTLVPPVPRRWAANAALLAAAVLVAGRLTSLIP
jgi:hypothetical protein